MDETELRLRELELRERQLAFEREKWLTEQDGPKKPKADWVRAFGTGVLAVLAPAVGVFLDVQQADQQVFETRMANLREGYDFYFTQRQALRERGDAADLDAVARTMSSAFPEAYCGVRADLHRIALGKGATPEENADLVWGILATDTVTQAAPKGELWLTQLLPWRRGQDRVITCEPISAAPARPAAQEPVAPQAEAKSQIAAAAAPALPDLAPSERPYSVYLHVSAGREAGVLGEERPYLAERGYRLAVGSRPMDFPFKRAQVTYYQDAQERDAQALAAWLSVHFQAEGLTFTAVRSRRPSLKEGLLELWVPAAAPKAPGPDPVESPSR